MGVHPTQVGQWKKELAEQASSLFEGKRGPKPVDAKSDPERLYTEIGRLKVEGLAEKKVWSRPVGERRAWIEGIEILSLTRQCVLAGVSRATVYVQKRHVVNEVDDVELLLLALLDAEYTRRPFYGSRCRLRKLLKKSRCCH
jgi:hypothetical protein